MTDQDVTSSKPLREQWALYFFDKTPRSNGWQDNNSQSNRLNPVDRPFHDWYRFVLSYPPHLVRDYLQNFGLGPGSIVLDPFCGTGTTVVEAKRNGICGVGVEANPFAHFASSVKVDWAVDPDSLMNRSLDIAEITLDTLRKQGIDDNVPPIGDLAGLKTLKPDLMKILINGSISPLPLHKTLVLSDSLQLFASDRCYNHLKLALGNALVTQIGNLRFGPEVGIGKQKVDVPIIPAWLSEVHKQVADLKRVDRQSQPDTRIHLADSRAVADLLSAHTIDAVITSPPYPNEKDYTRTTRLESVLLGFIEDMAQLRGLKKTLVRSNTRGVYVQDTDDRWVADHPEVQRISREIEDRRIELGKTSGFEKLYGRVTRLYFGGMARHLFDLRHVLKPGAKLAYVVGDQASYLQVMIRTGQLLADIAQRMGYRVDRIDLFRTRFATATQNELREEVLVLTWPGE